MDLTIIIPAHNEGDSLCTFLPDWIHHCSDRSYKLIIVDDGSTDNSAEIFVKYSPSDELVVINHKVNAGYGAALKTGIRHADTSFIATMDADGQHDISEIDALVKVLQDNDADMVVGKRAYPKWSNLYRRFGKYIIRRLARLLMKIPVVDLNSGFKIYDTHLAKKYIRVCPDSMAFSDIITLLFISQGHLVLEHPINIRPRATGRSTISSLTAFETLRAIFNMIVLFNPMKIFFPISVILTCAGVGWGLPFVMRGEGVSVGAMLGTMTGILIFCIGLLADQLAAVRKDMLNRD